MKKEEFTRILILLGGVSFAVGIVWKLFGWTAPFEPQVYWRFAMGCLALAIALALHKLAYK